MSYSGDCSVMKEISKAEEAIGSTYARLDALEEQLNDGNLPEERQKVLRLELAEVRKLLKTNEEQLAHLRTHNRTSFIFVAALVFVCFAVYMLYILVRGNEF